MPMMSFFRCFLLSLFLVSVGGCSRGVESGTGNTELARQLIGTWVLAGAPDGSAAAQVPAGRLKFFTGRHWIICQPDPRTGEVVFLHGGTYTVRGDILVQQVEYAKANTMELVGQSHQFRATVSGDKLIQVGIGNRWNETWRRLQ